MCGNGAATGMEVTPVAHRPILKVLTMDRTVSFVVAVGLAMRGSVVLLTATTSVLAVKAVSSGFALRFEVAFSDGT